MTKLTLHEIDTIFISYDEPNAEKNYAELVKLVPWAKRVHGVKGSDNAHKAAANLSETDRFISVDADNIIDPIFFKQTIDITDKNKDFVFSWCGRNAVNGLIYGNGGLKCWTKIVIQMILKVWLNFVLILDIINLMNVILLVILMVAHFRRGEQVFAKELK